MPDTTPTTDRVRSAAQRALQSLDDLIADTTDPGVEALGARHELATALFNTSPAPARLVLGTTDQQPETAPVDPTVCPRCNGVSNYAFALCAQCAHAAPVDRAAVLREAADALDERAAVLRELSSSDYSDESFAARELTEAADRFRRMADEAQQPETEAHPTVTLCDLMFEDGRQCAKPDGHRPPGSDDPHVPQPAPSETSPVEGVPDVPPTVAVYLASPCDACRHTLNWHRNDVGCTVALCVCSRFHLAP